MPRPRNVILTNFFKFNYNEIICNNKNCNNRVLNRHSSNLERHLKTAHSDLYAKYIQLKSENITKKCILKPNIKKELNKHNVELAIVELFTKCERPLSMLEDRAFQILAQPSFDAINISVNSHSVHETIMAFLETIESEIIEDIKGKLVSLQIDLATMQDLRILGIHIQYIKSNGLVIKTLAIKEIKTSHTSAYLKSVILNVLNGYSLNLNRILTVTTDNDANMFKAEAFWNEDLKIYLEEENPTQHIDLNSLNSDFAIQGVSSFRCGAHTIQLCVHDVLEDPEVKEKLEKCRFVEENLRIPTILNVLKNGRYTTPVTDCPTCWNTTFLMLQRLLELKEIISTLSLENANLIMSTELWTFIEDFLELFEPMHCATLKLQKEQLCFSELYIILMDLAIKIENMTETKMSKLLRQSIEMRKTELLDNDLFNAAVFLDPRIKVCLSPEQMDNAKKCIRSLYKRIISLKESDPNLQENLLQQAFVIKMEPSTSFGFEKKPASFADFLENLDACNAKNIYDTTACLPNLETDFLVYSHKNRMALSDNIIKFWNDQNNELSKVAKILLAIPATQVSTGRTFSALKFILSDQRNELSTFNVENMVLAKLNGVFNYEK